MKNRCINLWGMLLIVCGIVLMNPCEVNAEEQGDFSVEGTGYSYDVSTHVLSISGDCTVGMKEGITKTTKDHIDIKGGCTVTLKDIYIDMVSYSNHCSGIKISSTQDVILKIQGTNQIWGDDLSAAILKANDDCNLTITSFSGNDYADSLVAGGGRGGAGIGGDGGSPNAKNITIAGGKIAASSQQAAAGIGAMVVGEASNITITGGIVEAYNDGSCNAIGGGQLQNGISVNPDNCSLDVWVNNNPEPFVKNCTSFLDMSEWDYQSIKIAPSLQEDNEMNGKGHNCEHNYEWIVEKEPTSMEEGVMSLKCIKCGDVKESCPLSAYAYYIMESTNKIKDAAAGSTVSISSRIWNSFPRSFFEGLAKRRDITVKIQFPYEHKYYEITIVPTQIIDISDLQVEYYGPKNMSGIYNAKEIDIKMLDAK